jgi:hypothetical protein
MPVESVDPGSSIQLGWAQIRKTAMCRLVAANHPIALILSSPLRVKSRNG